MENSRDVRIIHIYNGNHPVGSIGLTYLEETGNIDCAAAFCHPKDNFKYSEARKKVIGRLKGNFLNKKNKRFIISDNELKNILSGNCNIFDMIQDVFYSCQFYSNGYFFNKTDFNKDFKETIKDICLDRKEVDSCI